MLPLHIKEMKLNQNENFTILRQVHGNEKSRIVGARK